MQRTRAPRPKTGHCRADARVVSTFAYNSADHTFEREQVCPRGHEHGTGGTDHITYISRLHVRAASVSAHRCLVLEAIQFYRKRVDTLCCCCLVCTVPGRRQCASEDRGILVAGCTHNSNTAMRTGCMVHPYAKQEVPYVRKISLTSGPHTATAINLGHAF